MAEAPGASGMATGRGLLVLVISLFFIWGGITSLNDILIPKLKTLFQLNYAQAMLIQFAFFTAYAIVSLPAGVIVGRLGYGKGIAGGLTLAGVGCLIFVPAASNTNYPLFLTALFILASGLTILQVAANPLIANLGSAATSHSRLTFAQAFNSLGTTIMPYIGAQLILSSIAKPVATGDGAGAGAYRVHEAAVLGQSYLGIAIVLVLIASVFWWIRKRLGGVGGVLAPGVGFDLLRRPRLALGILAIFVYVGAEVSIGSLLVNYLMLPKTLGLDQRTAGEHISLYWGGALVGRFIGAAVLSRVSPGKVLAATAVGAIALISISALTTGPLAGWSLVAVGLMNAIMFPTIFSLALEGLGERTPQGSGLLCMAIVGGAILPVVTGMVADVATLTAALVVPGVCYAMIAGYGWLSRQPAEPALDSASKRSMA